MMNLQLLKKKEQLKKSKCSKSLLKIAITRMKKLCLTKLT